MANENFSPLEKKILAKEMASFNSAVRKAAEILNNELEKYRNVSESTKYDAIPTTDEDIIELNKSVDLFFNGYPKGIRAAELYIPLALKKDMIAKGVNDLFQAIEQIKELDI